MIDIEPSLDFAIAITEHLNSIDPQELVDLIINQMDQQEPLSGDERIIAATAVLHAYNAIVAGAALAAAVGPTDPSSA